jgi:hypothetical protein
VSSTSSSSSTNNKEEPNADAAPPLAATTTGHETPHRRRQHAPLPFTNVSTPSAHPPQSAHTVRIAPPAAMSSSPATAASHCSSSRYHHRDPLIVADLHGSSRGRPRPPAHALQAIQALCFWVRYILHLLLSRRGFNILLFYQIHFSCVPLYFFLFPLIHLTCYNINSGSHISA